MFDLPAVANDETTNPVNKQPTTINIQYILPNQQQQHNISLRIDLTIDYLKLQLYKLHNIELHTYNIYSTDNKVLPEPMSLSDFNFVKAELAANAAAPTVAVQLRYTEEFAHLNSATVSGAVQEVDTDDELDALADDDLLNSSSDEDD